MLQRKVQKSIEEWYRSGHKKALLLTGARQVGKTTAVREFAKFHFRHFVEVNFVKQPIAQQAFDGNLDTRTIVTNLSTHRLLPFLLKLRRIVNFISFIWLTQDYSEAYF